MTTTSSPPVSNTVNPAGEPKVRITEPELSYEPGTRDGFFSDLRKVAKKTPKR
jgi:hypothetical protein